MPSPEQTRAPSIPGRKLLRGALLALTALAVPLLLTAYDVVNSGAICPHLLRRDRITYAESAALGLVLWGLGMEAARHPKRGVRAVALASLAFTAALGIGGQAYFRSISNEYLSREALLLAADAPGMFTGYVGHHALPIAAVFALPALVAVAVARARASLRPVARQVVADALRGGRRGRAARGDLLARAARLCAVPAARHALAPRPRRSASGGGRA